MDKKTKMILAGILREIETADDYVADATIFVPTTIDAQIKYIDRERAARKYIRARAQEALRLLVDIDYKPFYWERATDGTYITRIYDSRKVLPEPTKRGHNGRVCKL